MLGGFSTIECLFGLLWQVEMACQGIVLGFEWLVWNWLFVIERI